MPPQCRRLCEFGVGVGTQRSAVEIPRGHNFVTHQQAGPAASVSLRLCIMPESDRGGSGRHGVIP